MDKQEAVSKFDSDENQGKSGSSSTPTIACAYSSTSSTWIAIDCLRSCISNTSCKFTSASFSSMLSSNVPFVLSEIKAALANTLERIPTRELNELLNFGAMDLAECLLEKSGTSLLIIGIVLTRAGCGSRKTCEGVWPNSLI